MFLSGVPIVLGPKRLSQDKDDVSNSTSVTEV